jgi:DNA-binding NarL/FixJ family response regulator
MKRTVKEKPQQKVAEVKKTGVLIVDDHPIIRFGLAKIINSQPDFAAIGEADDAATAMEAIKTLKPDCAVIDISLKNSSGLELIKDIRIRYSNLPILAISMHDESLYAERVLRAGAQGYIMKEEATENLVTAIRKVMSGQVYTSSRMAAKMVRKLISGKAGTNTSPVERLSDRELEVFSLIGQGYGTRQISEKLYLSIKTIETYRAHIKEKLGFASATELLQYAIQWAISHNGAESSEQAPPD